MRLLIPFMLLACSEYNVKQLCVDKSNGFDIEEVSVLQDAAGYAFTRDAVIMDFDGGSFAADEGWRVISVEVMAMIPTWYLDPYEATPWVVTQRITKSDWEWRAITLPGDAAVAGQTLDFEQTRAWVRFDFSEEIPESGMTSNQYLVSVAWNSYGTPAVGYSNFNLACDKNWTDSGSGFILNSTTAGAQECSWPMLRLEIETRRYEDDC